ncbi:MULTISPECIES: hypothetical protein [Aerococcus]|uniref:hypothetical protein n=1 Tax=Aerococcus urinae (strain CCUG 59500 / ACS-120-V-Col10a) TaxID=2976812 RepID=UPI000200E7ED|nr:hypothetical protein [Aerococcus sp. Group 1]AEA00465.1 hypothetical protein HMPREF9243_1907 [Aerococcus sp. Group 1]MCY3030358.1 hypothetical protein [Aerococcus sp. Group 1]MCY3054890.1 hypothetical protein [Aerococcus sp. Group 1]MCY3056620.1 hypothetical protein [Aerococcus sp. Group 1]MCY3061798.1 hypothetical protein [Aerococcus sp. Group 1]
MKSLKELEEAHQACQEVLVHLDKGIELLQSASKWGMWDLLGGDFLPSLIKRRRIQAANQEIESLAQSLRYLNQELADVSMALPQGLSDGLSDNILDTWFDNVFTDARVQSDIKDQLQALQRMRRSIAELEKDLTEKLGRIP